MPAFEMVDGPDDRPMLTEVRIIGRGAGIPTAEEIDPTLPYEQRWFQAAGWNPWERTGRLTPVDGVKGNLRTRSPGNGRGASTEPNTSEGTPPIGSAHRKTRR